MASDLQAHLDVIRAGAAETLHAAPEGGRLAAARDALALMSDAAAAAGSAALVEAAGIVDEALCLAATVHVDGVLHVGPYVTAVAADLARVAQAIAAGEDPAPSLEHARAMLRAMPRPETTELLEVDLSDREQLARVLAAVESGYVLPPLPPDDAEEAPARVADLSTREASPLSEIQEHIAAYAALARTLLTSPGRADALESLLQHATYLETAAASAQIPQVERVAGCVAHVLRAHHTIGLPLSPDAMEFVVACQRIIPMILDAIDEPEVVARAVDALIEQSANLLIQLHQASEPSQPFWPAEATTTDAERWEPEEGHSEQSRPGEQRAAAVDGGQPKTLLEALRLLDTGQLNARAVFGGDGTARSTAPIARFNGTGSFEDPLVAFAQAIAGIIPRLAEAVIDLERNPASTAVQERLPRILHGLQSAAAVAGAEGVMELCRRIEGLMDGGRNAARTSILREAHALADELERLIADAIRQSERATAARTGRRSLRVDGQAVEDLITLAGELAVKSGAHEQRSRRLAQSILDMAGARDRMRDLATWLEEGTRDPRTLLAVVRESVADVSLAMEDLEHLRLEFDAIALRRTRILAELDDGLRRLRLASLQSLVPRLERAALGVARRQGKSVRLVVEGGSTGVDAMILDGLTVALLHLVRNAVEHGIEAPEVRRAAGKPEQGTVRLRAYRDGSQAVLQVMDDGAGIDDRLLAQRAAEYGYPVPPHGLTRERILQFVFLPGFSGKRAAGRTEAGGAGLDLVGVAVSEIGGTITVDSEVGQGTTFTLRVPLVPSLVEAPVVAVSGERYVMPFMDIEPADAALVGKIMEDGEGYSAEFGAEVLLAVDLGALLGVRSAQHLKDANGRLLLVRHGGERWLVRVDGVFERQDLVLQPLGRHTQQLTGAVGTTVLSSGKIALILDLAQLLDSAHRPRRRRTSQTATLTHVPFVLIADDSLSVRRNLTQALEHDGWRVLEARDGMETREVLESTAPDLLIVDVDLPLLDAFKVARVQSRIDVPLIGLVAQDDNGSRARAQALGAGAVLTKPWETGTLLRTIQVLTRSDDTA